MLTIEGITLDESGRELREPCLDAGQLADSLRCDPIASLAARPAIVTAGVSVPLPLAPEISDQLRPGLYVLRCEVFPSSSAAGGPGKPLAAEVRFEVLLAGPEAARDVHLLRGAYVARQGRHEDALPHLDLAVALSLAVPEPWLLLLYGQALAATGQHGRAIVQLAHCERLLAEWESDRRSAPDGTLRRLATARRLLASSRAAWDGPDPDELR